MSRLRDLHRRQEEIYLLYRKDSMKLAEYLEMMRELDRRLTELEGEALPGIAPSRKESSPSSPKR